MFRIAYESAAFLSFYRKRYYHKIHLNDLTDLLKRLPNVVFSCNSKKSLTKNYFFPPYIVKYTVLHFWSSKKMTEVLFFQIFFVILREILSIVS